MPRLIELFSGTGTLSRIARQNGWETLTVDNDPKTGADRIVDINFNLVDELEAWNPDVIWASPPCESFSVASIGTHWGGGHRAYQPKTEQASKALGLIMGVRLLIEAIDPTLWYIENPRGVMRKVATYEGIRNTNTQLVLRHTVTYCQYNDEPGESGLPRMKPTDIWTNNLIWTPRPMCKNGDPCHEAAPRGAKTGTQGRNTYLHRSKLPDELCQEIIDTSVDVLMGDNALFASL